MTPTKTPKPAAHRWEFKARFRRGAFGWKSQPAIQRVREAVAEIKKATRRDPVLGADGAVSFLERVSAAIANVDDSSGAMGTAVNHAIAELVPIIATAPAETTTRQVWLERLFEAHAADEIPYIERLADDWGELCASKELSSLWADRLLDATRTALGPRRNAHEFFHATTACLSALYRAERYEEIVDLLAAENFWPYKRWGAMALAARGRKAEAIRYAEACRGPWAPNGDVDAFCEEVLLSSGLAEEAYRCYGIGANQRGTYLATFRAVARRYPHKPAGEILADLVQTTPGQEGKWFAAAKDAGLYDEALELASRTPCDPRTLTRAARDFAQKRPSFAVGAGLLALRWLVEGYGYDITGPDVRAAYVHTMKAAERNGTVAETRERIRELIAREPPGGFVGSVLGTETGG